MDPRRSLMAATIWLVVALATSFAAAASYWAGNAAEEIVVQQHVRRLALETDQFASDLSQALAARLDAVHAVAAVTPLAALFDQLTKSFPDLGWIALADLHGNIVAGNVAAAGDTAQTWFTSGREAPWLGRISRGDSPSDRPTLGDMSAPVHDAAGTQVGVIAARLNWQWASEDVQRLSTTLNPKGSALTLILDRSGTVVVGPDELRHRRWDAAPVEHAPPIEPATDAPSRPAHPQFERLTNGRMVLVARAPIRVAGQRDVQWQVQLSEPKQDVYQRANALRLRIIWISIASALVTALIGAIAARRLTDRLKRLTRSAVAVGRNEQARIDTTQGLDEVAQLGRAFAKVLDDLQRERSELVALSEELERRVAARTREVERLAEESRYSAIVRERLKIARDLHDTLAHSMMAMLSEVRLLRKLHALDPKSLAEELERAESVAHDGLNEARDAIAQMRVNTVRDTGLGPALKTAFDRFIDRTGLTGDFTAADPQTARFGDERAETLFRMAEEALRNIEKHGQATHATLALKTGADSQLELTVSDDGVGFDQTQSHPGHFGLVGLREQAQLIGAQLLIDSRANIGTTIRIRLRIAPEGL